MASGSEKALKVLRTLPRIEIKNVNRIPKIKVPKPMDMTPRSVGRFKRIPLGMSTKKRPSPIYTTVPCEPYYKDFMSRRQLPFMSLLSIQRLIDLGWIDVNKIVDLTALCNTKFRSINPEQREAGFNLTDEGADIFAAKINLEVQHANEQAIAAIERNGGTVVTKYYDMRCVEAMVDPQAFFMRGLPIPVNKLPNDSLMKYYVDPRNRGYLADPDDVEACRYELAQKYGYKLPDTSADPLCQMRKRPEQIWYGLEPGWIVNLEDKTILRPKSEEAREYYEAKHVYSGQLDEIIETDRDVHLGKVDTNKV